MSILGFTEVAKNTLTVTIDNEFTIKVASLPGIFILKLVAFNDRKLLNNKDADDLAFITANYLEINEIRATKEHYDIYEVDNFNIFTAGATLLGRDIKQMLQADKETIESFSKILETNKSLKYDETLKALQTLLQELKK